MAGQQRRLAHAAKRDSQSMKTLSLLGALFLPATYIASVFSMTFFNWQAGGGDGGSGGGAVVAPSLWIYFAITIPVTLLIVTFLVWWDKRREKVFAKEDSDIEAGIDQMEAQIMATMRQRTLSKQRTWETVGCPTPPRLLCPPQLSARSMTRYATC